jgi:hypothetical protein
MLCWCLVSARSGGACGASFFPTYLRKDGAPGQNRYRWRISNESPQVTANPVNEMVRRLILR